MLRIGLDLDHTVYGFPAFFREFIAAMHAAGHKIYVTSNHLRERWPHDQERLRALGIDPDTLSPNLMQQGPHDFGLDHKTWMSKQVDYMFDDAGAEFQSRTPTPVFVAPYHKSEDKRR